ncbi:MAG TPA: ABC transporter ATP-binding protein [Terriglobia bacterium]|nr:ABC transporter ATP-binding protein [Terriglobia bacterium]
MTRSEAQATTNYTLSTGQKPQQSAAIIPALKRLAPLLADEKRLVAAAFFGMILTNGSSLFGPVIISHTVDTYIQNRNFNGVLMSAAILLAVYIVGGIAYYYQTLAMGTVGRTVLFKLRNTLFTKIQDLPLAFFNQNKAGDLISRINNDTDKLNQFFSQALVQLAGNVFMMAGAAIFLLSLNIRLGGAALVPAIGVLILTQLISAWVKSKNLKSLQSLGGMSADIQESMSNFKVIVAFNRLDYFRQKFDEANERNFKASVSSGLANGVFMPVYGLAFNLAQLIVLSYGIYLITAGQMTVGLLIGFLLYVNSFYMPLRQVAMLWSSFQLALAALDRISDVLALESNMPVLPASSEKQRSPGILQFENVHFTYPGGQEVLRGSTFTLEPGKTYALVGPTGGGKTTTASLMARLYDPTGGQVLLDGKDIRSYKPDERTKKIGFILQEPFLFTGTIRDNVLYGNEQYRHYSDDELIALLNQRNVGTLLSRFEQGLQTKVLAVGDAISLGQKQIIAFMRAVLRDPQILILDEATANIDTVTEQQLEQILDKLPSSTTKVIIAHRLNTIANADEIFFINSGEIIPAGSMEHALDMLLHGKRVS